MIEYVIVEFDDIGNPIGSVIGCGKNKNTWDTTHSRSRAYYHKKELEKKYPNSRFKVVTQDEYFTM